MAEPAVFKRSPGPTDRHVGSRIRMRRNMLDLSQESLGEAVGLTFQQIQKYEKGTNRVGASRLQQIADALGCEPAWFFEGRAVTVRNQSAAAQRVDADFATFIADKYAPNIIRGFVRLAPQVKRAVVNFIAAVAGQTEEV